MPDRQHRHRPDHPGAVPEDDFEGGLGRPALLRLALRCRGQSEAGFHPEPAGSRSSAQILLAGDNFGCGSSREHAPWALTQYGFRAVISTSFADIFKQNSLKNSLLPIVVPRDVHAELFAESRGQREGGSGVADVDACPTAAAWSSRWTALPSTACSKAWTNWATSCSRRLLSPPLKSRRLGSLNTLA